MKGGDTFKFTVIFLPLDKTFNMASLKFKGNPVSTNGALPEIGQKLADFTLVKQDLSRVSLADLAGKKVVLNIFPSVDTGVCAQSVRTFNEKAADNAETIVVNVSKDLPFAHGRFCAAEGIENTISVSDFVDPNFGTNNGLVMQDGPLQGLLARAVVVLNGEGNVVYTELVDDIVNEPNYEAALNSLKA